jgi:hypothetical protein
MRDGGRQAVAIPTAVRDVDHFEVRSADGGYRIEAIAAPAGATAELVHPAREDSAPLPGPSLAVRLAHGRGFDTARLTATIAPGAR